MRTHCLQGSVIEKNGGSFSWFGDKDINQTFLKKTLIFGDVDKVYKDDVYNAILLNIKYYIYIQTDV
jgi:hypothetical protein